MKLFDFGRNNRLSIVDICDDEHWDVLIEYWVSGRLLGKYISIKLKRTNQTPLYDRKWLIAWNKLIDSRYRKALKK